MLCREVKVLMSPYLDGQLDQETTRQVEQHVTSCVHDCRDRLELMQQIPVVLQTDRMLAPRPEFTRLVMQKVIVQQQVGGTSTRFEASYTSLSVSYGSPSVTAKETETAKDSDDEAEPAQEDNSAKIISLAERRQALRPRNTSDLALRLSALAAALVVLVGAGIYIAAIGPTTTGESSTAAVYGAIKDLGDTLRNALGQPIQLVLGLLVAALVLIAVWYLLRPSPALTRENSTTYRREEQTEL